MKQQKIEDYHSVWENRATSLIKREVELLQSAGDDRMRHKESLFVSDKLEILNNILDERL